jgi:hypothetical protein
MIWRTACGVAAASLALGGCSLLLGLDDPTAASDGGNTIDGGVPDADPSVPDARGLETCTSQVLDGGAGEDTSAADDTYRPACADTPGNDVAFAWTAPSTDYYVFSTAGSSFDTVLTLRDGCDGEELACNNNVGVSPQSEVVRKVAQGTPLAVVVDGFSGARGMAQVTAARVTCPDQDVEGVTLPATFNTTGAGNDVARACGSTNTPAEDSAFHWVAPTAGLYGFRVSSTAFDPIVAVQRGPRCTDAQMGCNAGADKAEVVRRLAAGEIVSVVVDSVTGGGPFELEISPRGDTCPENGALPAIINQDRTTSVTMTSRTLAPSCGPIEIYDRGGVAHPMEDATFSLTTPTEPDSFSVSCAVSGTSAQPFILYALEGTTCSGAETDCNPSRPDSQNPNVQEATIFLSGNKTIPIPYTVVVAANSLTRATVTLATSCTIILAAR